MTAGSSGCDIAAAIDADIVLMPGKRELIPTGFCFEIPPGFEVQVRSRSGLAAKHGVMVLNSQAPSTPITVAKSKSSSSTSKRTHHCPPRRPHRGRSCPCRWPRQLILRKKPGFRRRSGEPEVSGIRGCETENDREVLYPIALQILILQTYFLSIKENSL